MTAVPAPLRARQFRAVWLAGMVSEAGDWLLMVALPLVVYRLTGSAFGTSIALLIELLPGFVLAPLAGWCVDRWDRRRVLVWVSLAQGVALSPLLLVHRGSDLPILYAVIFLESSLAVFFDPAKNAWLPTLVDTEDLVAANSLIGLGQNLARLVGGPVGGVLLAVGGLRLITAVDAISFLIAGVLIATVASMSRAPMADAKMPVPVGSFRSALAGRRTRSALLVTFIAQVAQGIFAVLFIVFVIQRLHGGDAEIGLYRGVQAIGAVLGALALTALARRRAAAQLVAPSLVVFGLLDFGLWNLSYLTNNEAIYLAIFIIVGAPGLLLVTGIVSALQAGTSDHELGRVFSALGLVGNAGQVIGIALAGVLADHVGLMTLLNAQAAIYLVAAIPAIRLTTAGRAARRARTRTPRRSRPALPAPR